MLRNEKGVHVPSVVPELSTARLLTSQWLEGAPILGLPSCQSCQPQPPGAQSFRAWYVPLPLRRDPRRSAPGNYTAQKDLSINCWILAARIFRRALSRVSIRLYGALQSGRTDMAVSAYGAGASRALLARLSISSICGRDFYMALCSMTGCVRSAWSRRAASSSRCTRVTVSREKPRAAPRATISATLSSSSTSACRIASSSSYGGSESWSV